MNLRILKKLSKRAVPYLERIGTRRSFYKSDEESLFSLIIFDRTDWERGATRHRAGIRQNEIVWEPKSQVGRTLPFSNMYPPSTPKKGTPMVGSLVGYEYREWEEETAWEAFSAWVVNHSIEFDENHENLILTRQLRRPSDYFSAADELLGGV